MLTNLDVRFEEALAKDTSLPAFLVDPTRALENSGAVQKRLASLRPPSRFAAAPEQAGVAHPGRRARRGRDSRRQDAGAAQARPRPAVHRQPALVQHPGRPAADPRRAARPRRARRLLDLHLHQLHPHAAVPQGAVRHLPQATGWRSSASRRPSSRSSRRPPTSQQAINSDGLRYPVVQDNRYGTWNAYQNQYWPAEYLIDAKGQVRHTQFGEGDYKQDEAAVRELLYEAGRPAPAAADDRPRDHAVDELETPGDLPEPAARRGLRPAAEGRASTSTPASIAPMLNEFGLHGNWNVTSQSVTRDAFGDPSPGASRRPTSTW